MYLLSNHYRVHQEQVTSQRCSSIDVIRLFLAWGVVTAHAHSSTAWATSINYFFIIFCVPFFFTTSLYYFILSLREPISTKNVLLKMVKRIGVPFLSWSVIYTCLLIVKHLVVSKDSPLDFIAVFLYGNSAEHLYYLPELIIMQLLVLALFFLIIRKHLATTLIVLVVTISYLSFGYWQDYFGVTPIGSIAVYLAVVFYLAYARKGQKVGIQYSIIGGALICLALYNWQIPYTNPLLLYVVSLPIGGLGLFLIVFDTKSFPLPPWLTTITTTTYGVYLSHVMFLEFFEFLFEKNDIAIHYDVLTKVAVGSLIFLVSVSATLLIRKNAPLRVLLLGENR